MRRKLGPAHQVGESIEDRHARWIESIERAHLSLDLDLSVDRARHNEIEDQLLRELGFRAPLTSDDNESQSTTKMDAAYRKGMRQAKMFFRYVELLFDEPGFGEKFEKIQSGECNVDVKRETWSAATKLFREKGGGVSPEHIRLTLQGIRKEMDDGHSHTSLIPFPSGDPPSVEN